MKRPLPVVFIMVLLGALSLWNLEHHSRLEAFRTVDIVQLIGAGMCFGIALLAFVASLRKRT